MYSFCLASLIQYNYFESHPFLCVCISVLHFLAQQYSIMWIKHSLFIHSPVYDCFGFFLVWDTMNKAALNIHVQSLYGLVLSLLLVKYLNVEPGS